MKDRLRRAVEARTDELVALTAELVRIPTVNPPGDAYRAMCELVGERLAGAALRCAIFRAEGTPGDSDHYPRFNVVARREGGGPGPACTSTPTSTWSRSATAGPSIRSAARSATARSIGRGTCDMKGGLAASIVAVETPSRELPRAFPGRSRSPAPPTRRSGGYGGVAYLARQGLFSQPRVDHVIIPEPLNKDRICLGHRGVWWAEIETIGRIAHGSMPFLGDCAIRHMAAVLDEIERELCPALADAPDGACRWCREARAPSTLNINSIHGGQTEDGYRRPARPRACPTRCRHRDRPPLPDRGGHRARSRQEVRRSARAAGGASGRASATSSAT